MLTLSLSLSHIGSTDSGFFVSENSARNPEEDEEDWEMETRPSFQNTQFARKVIFKMTFWRSRGHTKKEKNH